MTTTLKIKNVAGQNTVDVMRVENRKDVLPVYIGTLKPGEENEFIVWGTDKLVIQEIIE